ncbi:hypothetical protein DM01DRAFT_1347885 [Hesseltinella vesiculosa]|uniref:Uncharacterized protein n=1 Tax=Hesseltinella vesiculosa TaxID=101127 RepID=A0A1X2GAA0_9FUNG|nr:hypothetical protein DM01DRAFT_1347885 [Hesseltinella vesiculosa]
MRPFVPSFLFLGPLLTFLYACLLAKKQEGSIHCQIERNERTLRHQKRRPDQKQPSRLHPDDHCPPGKRHQFEGFMGCDKVETALAQGELYYGRLRINAKPVDAFVTYDALDSDVFVCNARNRNRALGGDLVAIQHPD